MPNETLPAESEHPDDATEPQPEFADLDGDGIPDDLDDDPDDLSDVVLGAEDEPVFDELENEG